MTVAQANKWLAEQFEFEYCGECGQDADRHEVCAGPFGLPFARCISPDNNGQTSRDRKRSESAESVVQIDRTGL